MRQTANDGNKRFPVHKSPGENWLDISKVPGEAFNRWYVGLTDSAGNNHILGKLTHQKTNGYTVFFVPGQAARGKGKVWTSTETSPAAAGLPARQIHLVRETAGQTRSWHEIHTIVKGIDVALLYRPPVAETATAAYHSILQTLKR